MGEQFPPSFTRQKGVRAKKEEKSEGDRIAVFWHLQDLFDTAVMGDPVSRVGTHPACYSQNMPVVRLKVTLKDRFR